MSRRERQRRRNRSKGGPGRIVFLTLGLLTAVLAIAGLSGVGYIVSIASSAPSIDTLKVKDPGSNSTIFTADGQRLGVIQAEVLRQPIPSTSIPQYVKDATVAVEDRRFYQHKGVDFEGVIRAAVKNAESGDAVQGGSTLTMQLIKNLYSLDRRRDYKRKIREAKLAEELENRHPGPEGKQWILVKYVNNVPYGTVGGQQAIGIQAAARVFFDKRAAQLTLPEAALLAGLPQAPTDYNPYLNPEGATARRNDVLRRMVAAGYITAAEGAEATGSELGLKRSTFYRERRESYFFDYVRTQLVKKYGVDKVRRGGLKIYTTIDLRKQRQARAAIQKHLAAPGSPSSAVVSVDPKTGHIKAMASSSNYGDSKFNLAAQGRRQPGSTAKIFVLMAALRRGVDINRTSYVSKKLNFTDPGTGAKIDVDNSDGATSGKSKTVFQATVSSDNTVFQQLDLDLGPKEVTRTAVDMGITSPLDSIPAEALGGYRIGVSPLQMARSYATINNGGKRVRAVSVTKVVFPDGTVDKSLGRVGRVDVFTDGETYEAIQAMKGNVTSGTGTKARLNGCVAAGKTGTTSGFKDAWFNGMTRGLNTTVWVGYPVPREMTAVPNWGRMFGGTAPASIWNTYMQQAVKGTQCGDWPKPKKPFVAKPFFGKYSRSAPRSTFDPGQTGSFAPGGNGGYVAPTPPPAASAPVTPSTGGGNQEFPPEQYESPPAAAPAPAQPEAADGISAGGAGAG